jgi:Leucine-rich repeat (LRR) protein
MTREELLRLIDQAADEGWTELDLAGLGLEELPGEIGKCTQLETLVLGKLDRKTYKWVGNQLTEFPDAVLQLTNLKILSLASNQITEIPEAIAKLSNLTGLELSRNQIIEIPEAIAKLSNLTGLDLSRNQIIEIPEAIAKLSNLTGLDLSRNQIIEIPDGIRSMEKLEKLDLRGNPIPIPPEILGEKEFYKDPGDLRTILDFYFQTRDPNATEELNEAKLLIVGEGEAGKTTLANKLLNPDYELKQQEPATEGIDVMRWEFLQPNGKPFRVHLWDFGGQEIYHATH